MPYTVMGVGTTYYGRALREPDGSYVATEWLVALNMPVLPLRSWRLWPVAEKTAGTREAFQTQPVPLHLAHVWKGYAVTLLLVVLVMLLSSKRTYMAGASGLVLFVVVGAVLLWREVTADREAATQAADVGRESRPRAGSKAARRSSRSPSTTPPAAAGLPPVAKPPTARPTTPALRIKGAIPCVRMVAPLATSAEGERLTVRMDATGTLEGEGPAVRATGGLFGVFYAVDEGSHYTYVTNSELETVGIKLDDMHAIGLRNLAARVKAEPGLRLERTGTLTGLVVGGDFEASLVLLDPVWSERLKGEVASNFVVALPTRDVCAFCDSRSPEAIEALRMLTERLTAKGERLLCDRLLRRENERWRLYEAP